MNVLLPQAIGALAVMAMLGAAASARQQQPPAPGDRPAARQRPNDPVAPANQDVRVRTSLTRTAIWVGDPVEYVVELACAPNVDVLTEDLAKEKVKLDGLEMLSAATDRAPVAGGGVKYTVRYRVTAYDIEAPVRTINGWSIRYYVVRPGQRPEDTRPAGEVQVPAAFVALRSALPDQLQAIAVRDDAAIRDLPPELRIARSVGLGLMAAAAAPLALWAVALARGARRRKRRPSARAARSHARAALDELRALDATSETGRREAYGRLALAVRQHLAETRGIPAQALSAGEVVARLRDTPAAASAETVGTLLTECEHATYGPLNRVPPEDRFSAALRTAEEVFGS